MEAILDIIVSNYYIPALSKAAQAVTLFLLILSLRILENIGCQLIDRAFIN